jgi:radical SAM peptide maturase (CXXX-repeat target family)
MKQFEQYSDMISRLYPQEYNPDKRKVLSRTITFQVTDACNLACTYCYQINKGTRVMEFETARKLIDMLLTNDKRLAGYVDDEVSPAIIIEFIGGEPFLQVDLIEQICDYFVDTAIELNHTWAYNFAISICSNGVLYFDEKVQRFLNKYRGKLSFSITIDGNKELHDACRVFPNGQPSYDLAVAGANDWMARGNYMGSKITIAPENLPYLYNAILHMVDLGYHEINANVVYENVWKPSHAKEYYRQLIKIADYFIDNDLVEDYFLALFDTNFFVPMDEEDNDNWCGGTGSMLSCDPDGYLYPCIRYMESSLGCSQKAMRIGHVDEGIAQKEEYSKCVDCLNCITRRSQSTDECFYCPIAKGCSWCSAYNFQETGSPNKRVTYICDMHKARSLANVYYWNSWYRKKNKDERFEMHCPKEWALEIVSEEEYNKLINLSK